MDRYVLRKTIGSWSPGTEIEIEDDIPGHGCHIRLPDGSLVTVRHEMIVLRRLRTMMIPLTTSRERHRDRRAKRKAALLDQPTV